MKRINTFSVINNNSGEKPQPQPPPIFASVPRVEEPYRLHIPQFQQAQSQPNISHIPTMQSSSQPTNVFNTSQTSTQTTQPPSVQQVQSQPSITQTPSTFPPRVWNVSINSYQQSSSTSPPVYYMYSKPRANKYYYTSYVSSTGARTTNTNNICISIH